MRSWVSFFKTNRIKDLVEAVRKDIRQLTTQATQSAKTYVMPESHQVHSGNSGNAVRKDIRHAETFTLISPTLNKHNHCSPQRHTIFLFDFLLSSCPQSAKTYDLKKHLLSDLPTLNKHNHCSPQRHTIFLFDFLLSSWPQSAKTYDLLKHLLSDLLHVTSTTIAVRKDIQLLLHFPLSSWPRHLQCAEQQVSRSNLTKYCACHAERLTYLVLITYETSFTVRGTTGVTIQPHQILRLSHRKTHRLSPHRIWNVIYSARSNRCHEPTSPNTAPVTQKDSHT